MHLENSSHFSRFGRIIWGNQTAYRLRIYLEYSPYCSKRSDNLVRGHSKMTSPQKWHILDSLPPCHPLPLFFVTPFSLPPGNLPKSDKPYFRKANYKIYFGTYLMFHIINLIINRWLKR